MSAGPARTGSDWPSLAVVVPVYNEGPGIEHSCTEIVEAMGSYAGRAVVIAVDDGSADDSGEHLAAVASRYDSFEVCTHAENLGYGAALRTGAKRAAELSCEYTAFIDSDLTNPPEDLLTIGELARAGHPYIKGSRFIPGGGMADVPPRRQLFSRAGNAVGRALFGTKVRDVTNGFRAVRTELYLSWPLHERGFPVIVEELDWVLRSGIEPVEFPTVLTSRGGTQRPSAFPYSPEVILTYLRYPARALARRLGLKGRATS